MRIASSLVLILASASFAGLDAMDASERPSRQRKVAAPRIRSESAPASLSHAVPPIPSAMQNGVGSAPSAAPRKNATSVFVLRGDGASRLLQDLHQQAIRHGGARIAGFAVADGGDGELSISRLSGSTAPSIFTRGRSTNLIALDSVAIPELQADAHLVILDGLCRTVMLSLEIRKVLQQRCGQGVVVVSIAPDLYEDATIAAILESRRARLFDVDENPGAHVSQEVSMALASALSMVTRHDVIEQAVRSSSQIERTMERSGSSFRSRHGSAVLHLSVDDVRLSSAKIRQRGDHRRKQSMERMAAKVRARSEDAMRGARQRARKFEHLRDKFGSRGTQPGEPEGNAGQDAIEEWSRPSEVDRQTFMHADADGALDATDATSEAPADHWHSA